MPCGKPFYCTHYSRVGKPACHLPRARIGSFCIQHQSHLMHLIAPAFYSLSRLLCAVGLILVGNESTFSREVINEGPWSEAQASFYLAYSYWSFPAVKHRLNEC